MMKSGETVIEGKILSRGIGFGKPIFLDAQKFCDENFISMNEIETEILKYRNAILESKKQILQLKKNFAKDKLSITFEILNTHLEILNDPIINQEVENRIKNESKSIEAIFHDIILDYKNKIKDPFFKEKAVDITDVFKRILSNIRSVKIDSLKNFPSKSVILSNEIVPSDVFEIDERGICAFLSLSGSYESHAAIIARSKNIPFLSKVDIEKLKKINFKEMIVDANSGRIIINPTKETYKKYENLKKIITDEKLNLKKIEINNCNIFANISHRNEIDTFSNENLCGIGLLRTELYFLKSKELPCEEVQFEAYKELALKMKNLPLIIRLFDLGADKSFYHLSSNPCNFFDLRGVNYLLKNVHILKDQLRALLRAGKYGNIYILIPFVKDVEEIVLVKKYFQRIKKELNLEFLDIKIGSMIETPASVMMIEDIIKKVDFVSIGTNDLTRYTLACENFCSTKMHESMIKSINMVVKASKNSGKPLFLCGELISNIKNFNKLTSLGISNFSVSTKHLHIFEKNN